VAWYGNRAFEGHYSLGQAESVLGVYLQRARNSHRGRPSITADRMAAVIDHCERRNEPFTRFGNSKQLAPSEF